MTGDGQDFLPLYAQEDGDEDTTWTNSRILTVIFACIAAVLAVACVFLIRNKKSSNRQPVQDRPRYFMPYLKLDEEDEKKRQDTTIPNSDRKKIGERYIMVIFLDYIRRFAPDHAFSWPRYFYEELGIFD